MGAILFGKTYINYFGLWTTNAQRPQTRIMDNMIRRPGLWDYEIWSHGLWDYEDQSHGLWDYESAIIPRMEVVCIHKICRRNVGCAHHRGIGSLSGRREVVHKLEIERHPHVGSKFNAQLLFSTATPSTIANVVQKLEVGSYWAGRAER